MHLEEGIETGELSCVNWIKNQSNSPGTLQIFQFVNFVCTARKMVDISHVWHKADRRPEKPVSDIRILKMSDREMAGRPWGGCHQLWLGFSKRNGFGNPVLCPSAVVYQFVFFPSPIWSRYLLLVGRGRVYNDGSGNGLGIVSRCARKLGVEDE
ncbi:hypothetical protein BDZ91DRAFT_760016 [Kalaharituber pfeilii]|nr:hypothetical protein BDZ91DRAFT_760016 [Kalaharituber pfeilii]